MVPVLIYYEMVIHVFRLPCEVWPFLSFLEANCMSSSLCLFSCHYIFVNPVGLNMHWWNDIHLAWPMLYMTVSGKSSSSIRQGVVLPPSLTLIILLTSSQLVVVYMLPCTIWQVLTANYVPVVTLALRIQK